MSQKRKIAFKWFYESWIKSWLKSIKNKLEISRNKEFYFLIWK
jgi:hypothetical protein